MVRLADDVLCFSRFEDVWSGDYGIGVYWHRSQAAQTHKRKQYRGVTLFSSWMVVGARVKKMTLFSRRMVVGARVQTKVAPHPSKTLRSPTTCSATLLRMVPRRGVMALT